MDKVALIRDEMCHMDYLKDDFFDLVVSYATMASIESTTPGGTSSVLRQFHRILKKEGTLLIIEPIPPQEVKPVDEAQRLELNKIHDRVLPKDRYYNQSQLSELLNALGFFEIYGKLVSKGK